MAMRRVFAHVSNVIRKQKSQVKRFTSARSRLDSESEPIRSARDTTRAPECSCPGPHDTVLEHERLASPPTSSEHHGQTASPALSQSRLFDASMESLLADNEKKTGSPCSANSAEDAAESSNHGSSMALVLYDADSVNDITEGCNPYDLLRATMQDVQNDSMALVPQRPSSPFSDEAYRSMVSSNRRPESHADWRCQVHEEQAQQPREPTLTFRGKDLFTLQSIHQDIETAREDIAHRLAELSRIDKMISRREALVDRQLEMTGDADPVALEDIRRFKRTRERRSRAYDGVLLQQRDNWDDLRDFLAQQFRISDVPPLSRASSRTRTESSSRQIHSHRERSGTRSRRGRTETSFSQSPDDRSAERYPSVPSAPSSASSGISSRRSSPDTRRYTRTRKTCDPSSQRPIRLPLNARQHDSGRTKSAISAWDLNITERQVKQQAYLALDACHRKCWNRMRFAQAVFADRDAVVRKLWSKADPARSLGVPWEALVEVLEPIGQATDDLSDIIDKDAFRFQLISRLTRGLIETEAAFERIEEDMAKSGLRRRVHPDSRASNFSDRSDDGYRMSEEQELVDDVDRSVVESWMEKFPRNPIFFIDAIIDANKVAASKRRIDHHDDDEWDGASLRSHEGYAEPDDGLSCLKRKINEWRAAADDVREVATQTRAGILGLDVDKRINI